MEYCHKIFVSITFCLFGYCLHFYRKLDVALLTIESLFNEQKLFSGIWTELKKEHERLVLEQEKSREEFRNIHQVVMILKNDYIVAKEAIIFTRYSLLKAMVKRSVLYDCNVLQYGCCFMKFDEV